MRFVGGGLASLFVVCLLAAQSPTGRILGRAVDSSGGAIGGATIRAELLTTGRSAEARSGADGEYVLPALAVGRYELTASAEGFAPRTYRVEVEVGASVGLDLELLVAGGRESVEVVDRTPVLETGSAAVGTVIDRERLARLPLNERQFLQLALLAGGAHTAAPGSELASQGNSGLHLHGARETSNNFLLDGVDNNDLYINRVVVSPPLDSVEQFRLHSSSYQAEFGRSGGAQVNVVSRAGSNRLHGSIYEYLRNEALDARNFFDPAGEPIPKFRRHQFGLSTGGPLIQDRTFFFGGYEGTRVRDAMTRTALVPTAAELGGDFSTLGRPIIDPFTQAPFANNRIPTERLDPTALALAQAWPAPNRADAAQNLVTTPVGDALANQGYGRVDHYWSSRDALYARYNFSHDRSLSPFGEEGSNTPGFGSFVINRGQNVVVANTHTFGPTAVWEARFGFNRLNRQVLHQNTGNDVAGRLGIGGLSEDTRFVGFPAINIPGVDGLGDNTALPIIRGDNTYHLVQSVTLLRGRHVIKAGGEMRAITIDGIQGLFGRGQFNFLGAMTTNPLSDFLLGLPTYTIQTKVDNPFRQRTQSWNGYVQDDFRIARNVTLNLGLRYEWNRPAVDADDRFVYFDWNRRELVAPGQGELGRAGYRSDLNNFAPRLGLSWEVRGGTAVRAGYGVFHDLSTLEANSGLYFNPPYFDLRIFFPSQTQLLTLRNGFPTGSGVTPLTSVNTIDPSFRTGYVQHFNLGLEQELRGGMLLRASYIGSKGTKLLRRRDVNQPAPGPGDVNARRPLPGFANIVQFESASSSSYHSGVLSLERRFGRRLLFSAAHTWSRSIDDNSSFLGSDGDQGFPQNSHDFQAERGLSSFDQRHRLVLSTSYETPWRNRFARNWRLHVIGSFQAGNPFTPALSTDISNTGNSGSIFGQDRPDAVGDPFSGGSTPERFFNTNAFAAPAAFRFGSAGRNVLVGPGQASLDAAVERTLELGERLRLDLRAEAFNVTNHTNFDLPRRFADQPTFGRIVSAGAARQMQLGIRLTY